MDSHTPTLRHAECLAIATSARQATLRLPNDSGFFAGHFPEQPILPAIGQLQLLSDLLPHWFAGPGSALRQLASLRFQRPLGPGDTFELQLGEPAADGRASLLIRKEGGIVSRGAVLLGPAQDRCEPGASAVSPNDEAVTDFPLPHVGAARWISRVIRREPDQLSAEIRVPRESAFCRDSWVHSATSIEAAAQAAALLEALQRADQASGGQAEARAGYLVGAQEVSLHAAAFASDSALEVRVKLAGQAGPLAKYEFELRSNSPDANNSILVAAGQVSTFIAPAEN